MKNRSPVDNSDALAAAMREVSVTIAQMEGGDAVVTRLEDADLSRAPASVVECAGLLLRLGFVSQAGKLFQTLAARFPSKPAGHAGLVQIAAQRKNWIRALALSDDLIAAFPKQKNHHWQTMRARILHELDRHQEAEAVIDQLVREFPQQPFGYVARAQRVTSQRDWDKALVQWDDMLERFPQHDSVPSWKIARAHLLVQFGRYSEAEATFREALAADPWMIGALQGLLRVLAETDRSQEALEQLDASVYSGAVIPILFERKIEILLRLLRIEDARAEFGRHMQFAAGPETIDALLTAAPLLHEGWRLTQIWIELLTQLDRLPIASDPTASALQSALRARIKLALGDHAGFLASAREIDDTECLGGEIGKTLRTAAAAVANPDFPDYRKPKIFGIGLSKTGTTTLAAALNGLDFTTLHWTNPLTCELISDADLHLFDGFTDTPVCVSFEKYYHLFPNAKFIYTTRPLDSWTSSMTGFWNKVLSLSEFDRLQQMTNRSYPFRFGAAFREIWLSLYLNHSDFGQAYEAYDRRVRNFFSDKPKDKFLEFNMFSGHGWPELCAFLNTEIPARAFPFENRQPRAGA